MTSFLSLEMESGLVEGFDTFAPGDSRQVTHTATSKASNLSSGIVRLSSSSATI